MPSGFSPPLPPTTALATRAPAALKRVMPMLPALPLVMACWIASALLAYYIGRHAGRPLLYGLAGERRFLRLESAIDRGGASFLLACRLVPIVPFSLTGLVAGAAHVPGRGGDAAGGPAGDGAGVVTGGLRDRHRDVRDRHLGLATRREPAQLEGTPQIGAEKRHGSMQAKLDPLGQPRDRKQQRRVVTIDIGHGLAELRRELVGERACHDVRQYARGKRDDELDGTRRILIRLGLRTRRRSASECGRGNRCEKRQDSDH